MTPWVRESGTGHMNDLGRHLRLQSEFKGAILAVAAAVTVLCAWVTLVAQSNASHRLITDSAGTVASSSVQRTMFTTAENTHLASIIPTYANTCMTRCMRCVDGYPQHSAPVPVSGLLTSKSVTVL